MNHSDAPAPLSGDQFRKELRRAAMRAVAAAAFVAAGANHFANPVFYRSIVPPGFPRPDLLVSISGICEILGGAGLLVRPLRRAAGWGLIALLVAVFPANVSMLTSALHHPGGRFPLWLLWLRLPLQALFIVWVWYVAELRRRS